MLAISISIESPFSDDAAFLMEELSQELEQITGNSGKHSFNLGDIDVPNSLFVIARNMSGDAVGCGALRPLSEDVAEIKRVYSRVKKLGIGKQIVNFLERQAKTLRYKAVCLETRRINVNAVMFYKSLGYQEISNYGIYAGKPEAICFKRML